MTAEIAILNRTGIALAADSAATLMGGQNAKANNNADKLFHLCDGEPVGLMIFGNAEFMGIPLEPIVKEFRSCPLAKKRDALLEYADAFFEFLEKMTEVSDYTRTSHIQSILDSITQPLFNSAFQKVISKQIPRRQSFQDVLADAFKQEIESSATEKSGVIDCEIMDDVSHEMLVDAYRVDARSVIEDRLKKMPFGFKDGVKENLVDALTNLLAIFLKKNVYSDNSTGFAFAGFGHKDTFPSLLVYDTEGIISGRVKRSVVKKVKIDPAGPRGHVESLAQSDVVQRYTEGIDPKLNKLLSDKLLDSVRGFAEALADEWLPKKGKRRAAAAATIDTAAPKAVESFLREVIDKAKDEEKQDITSVVNFMSKSELAQLAEALVEMTALRRRVSMEVETVGGPTDVAVISKGDGFVWIKRKHYFDAALNPRYFVGQRLALEMRRNGHGEAEDHGG